MTGRRPGPLFAVSALAAGTLAAVALPGHSPGLNLVLVCLAFVAVVWGGARPDLTRWDSALLILGAAPLLLAVLRGSPWLLMLQVIAVLLAVAAGVSRAEGWTDIATAPFRMFARPRRGLVIVTGPLTERIALDSAALRPVLRVSLLSAGLLVVFGTLFVSADAAFAVLARDWLVPDVTLDLLPLRVVTFMSVVGIVGSTILLSPALRDTSDSLWEVAPRRSLSFRLGPQEWKIGLVVLNGLFASFVIVQLTVLFGGHTHVLQTTGLTYSEYARAGFLQLVAVAVLTLGVIASVVRSSDHESDRGWLLILGGLLCALTLVILVSALRRMGLYQEAYGFTRTRLLVDLFIYLLGIAFLLVMLAGLLWNGRWLPRVLLISTVTALIGFGLADPDARIARRNVERFEASGDIDLAYLGSLSVDAVPALLELDHPQTGCLIDEILERSPEDRSLLGFNLARRRSHALPRPPCNRS